MAYYCSNSPTWLKVRQLTDECPSSLMNASLGFTQFHAALLDLCFGFRQMDPSKVESVRDKLKLDGRTDLDKLMYMVLVEFATSLERDRAGEEESLGGKEPRPYDIFVMKTTFGQASKLSVLFPMKKGQLMWWDGDDGFEAYPQSTSPHHKIASLSGPARVLEGLHRAKYGSPLSTYAMRREKVFLVADQTKDAEETHYQASTSWTRGPGVSDPSLLESLNRSQQQAVKAVVSPSFDEGFIAIQGPPGCGKTTTMVRMIAAIGSNMIVVAPSNAAVANVALKLFESGRFAFGEMQKDLIRVQLARWLGLSEESSMIDLNRCCPDIQVDDMNIVTNEGRKEIGQILRQSKVILCTLNSSGSSYLHSLLERRTILLDEGGQCTEAEFYLATTFPGVKKIIVMGDPKQLRSTVLSQACVAAGFGESWLGNVYFTQKDRVHLLDTQYRMDPAILHFPNRQFYSQKIQSGENVSLRTPKVDSPFCFIDTQGRGREEDDGNKSIQNSYEIAVVKECLRNDLGIATVVASDPQARIIVVAPYKAQTWLLSKMVKSSFPYMQVDVSTVDAIQGQEADIVIVSLVRTRRVGFIDDPQRLNVALTRAKRVLRIVGDWTFCFRQTHGSTLRELSLHAEKMGSVKKSSMRRLPNCPPDFSIQTHWKLTLTQRFHNSISLMGVKKKNVSLNTLFAIALPDLTALANPIKETTGWHTSFLKGHRDVRIIWVARDHEDFRVVEAHFAGNSGECLRFRQCHMPPDGCCSPRTDMSAVVPAALPPSENGSIFMSWALNNSVQNTILNNDKVVELPLSMIQLDPLQDKIARSPPPLLLESRSGTGKTLVLLQHAAFYCRISDPRPACFVTVSQGLRNELDKKYQELTPVHGAGLPQTLFFTFHELVQRLLSHHGIRDFEGCHLCTFRGYVAARYKHQHSLLDTRLIENEVGGVILGSVVAAKQKCPMSRGQYLAEIRSNIQNTAEGQRLRNLVFDEYRFYHEWKRTTNKYDIGDVVLRLLQEDQKQLFASEPGIEKQVKEVQHLVVNYRTTRDILLVGNSILESARMHFPGAIDFARPERARKDLGLKVALCPWDAAFKSKVKFGSTQAFIYSSPNESEISSIAGQWLDGHPFILSSLQSKGLEFDDIVVAFDHERKTWQLHRKLEQSLTVLRELYVAVTRAQQRVVILVKGLGSCSAMRDFLYSLGCDFELVDRSIFEEFDRDTSTEVWFEKAQGLLGKAENELAAKCFTRAKRQDWSCLSQGRHFLRLGLLNEADKQFRRAARVFYEHRELDQIVHILCELLKNTAGVWDKSDDAIFIKAVSVSRDLIPRVDVVRYGVLREDFSSVNVNDLKDRAVCALLHEYRETEWLKQLVADCTEIDRADLELTVPEIVADYYFDQSDYVEACRVCLSSRSFQYADKATIALLEDIKRNPQNDRVLKIAQLWHNLGPVEVLPCDSASMLFSELFRSPQKLSTNLKKQCVELFGKDLVKFAVETCRLDKTILLQFDDLRFKEEVEACLVSQLGTDLVRVVAWYNEQGYSTLASDFAKDRRELWTNERLIFFIKDLKTRHVWLFEELQKRKLLDLSIALAFLSPYVSVENRMQIAPALHRFPSQLLKFKSKGNHDQDLAALVERITKASQKSVNRIFTSLTTNRLHVEKALLKVFLDCDRLSVVECSMEALGTFELANENLIRVFTLWTNTKQLRKSTIPTIPFGTPVEKFLFLLCLFFGLDPSQSCDVFFELDSQSTIAHLFGPSVAAYCQAHIPTAPGEHDEKLFQRFVDFHTELKSTITSECVAEGTNRNNSVVPNMLIEEAVGRSSENVTGPTLETSPPQTMSKKSARKQKQATKSKGKKQKPRKKINKKKNQRK